MVDRDLLSDVDLFADLDGDALDQILSIAEDWSLVRGDVVFEQGDEADALYVVTDGRVAISSRSADGRESVFALMERGDLFGEMSLFDGLGRSADARALEPSGLIVIPFAPLRELWESRPSLLWPVVRMLTRRLRAMDHLLADAYFLDVTGRTAKHLLELAAGRDRFELPVTQEELAGMVGASRERVNKAISSFVRLGWIAQEDRTYEIVRRDELEFRSR